MSIRLYSFPKSRIPKSRSQGVEVEVVPLLTASIHPFTIFPFHPETLGSDALEILVLILVIYFCMKNLPQHLMALKNQEHLFCSGICNSGEMWWNEIRWRSPKAQGWSHLKAHLLTCLKSQLRNSNSWNSVHITLSMVSTWRLQDNCASSVSAQHCQTPVMKRQPGGTVLPFIN